MSNGKIVGDVLSGLFDAIDIRSRDTIGGIVVTLGGVIFIIGAIFAFFENLINLEFTLEIQMGIPLMYFGGFLIFLGIVLFILKI